MAFQNRHDRLLDDFVLQAQNAQRPFRAVRLRDVGPSGRTRSVAAPVHLVVQVLQLLFEVFSVGLPRHAVDARRGVPFKRKVAPLQEIDGDVMQQRSEPYTLALSRRLAHGDASPFDAVSRRSVRAAAVSPPFPLGEVLPSTVSAEGKPSLFGRFIGYYDLVRILIRVHAHRSAFAFMSRPGLPCPDTDETSQVPCKELLHVHKVSDCARFFPCKPFAMGRCCLLFNGTRSAPRN